MGMVCGGDGVWWGWCVVGMVWWAIVGMVCGVGSNGGEDVTLAQILFSTGNFFTKQ